MAKIGQSLSFTFRLPGANNQFSKVNIDISDIDTSLPIEPQLKDIDKTLDMVWKFIKNKVNEEIDGILSNDDSK